MGVKNKSLPGLAGSGRAVRHETLSRCSYNVDEHRGQSRKDLPDEHNSADMCSIVAKTRSDSWSPF